MTHVIVLHYVLYDPALKIGLSAAESGGAPIAVRRNGFDLVIERLEAASALRVLYNVSMIVTDAHCMRAAYHRLGGTVHVLVLG